MLAVVRRLLGEQTFARGQSYERQGRVRTLSYDGNLVVASVQGSAAEPYGQQITLRSGPDRVLRTIDGHCDCPVGRNCKHVAAALVALATRETAYPPSAPAVIGLPPAITSWLAGVRAADAPEPGEEDDGSYPESVRDRLIYVVDVEHSGRPTVTPMKATLKKDGTFGKGARRFDASRLYWADPPRFLRRADERILRRIDFLRLTPAPVYAAPRGAPEPGEIPDLLAMIAATGRGRWQEVHGPTLGDGGPRDGRLVWLAEEDGRQRPGVVDADGAALVALAVEPPVYVDPVSAAFGPLAFETPPRLALALLAAPDIPPEAAGAVAEAFGALVAAPPPPRRMHTETRQGIAPTAVLRLMGLTARQRHGRWSALGAPVVLPALRLDFDYAGRFVHAFPFDNPTFRDGDVIVTLERDRALEERLQDRLADCGADPLDHLDHLSFARGAEPLDRAFAGAAWAPDPEYADTRSEALAFIAETAPRLRAEGWRVEIDPSWPCRLHEGPVQICAALESGGTDWFSLGLTLEAGGQRIDLAPLVGTIIGMLPLDEDGVPDPDFDLEEFLSDLMLYQRLDDGSHVPIEAATLAPLVHAVRGLIDGFHAAEAARVADLAEALAGCGVPFEGGAALVELGRRLRALSAAPLAEPPPGLAVELRPYQKTGYGWLSALAETGFGGVLADDMGLGKTLQTLALLLERRHVRARPTGRPARRADAAWSATGGARPSASRPTSACWCCTAPTGTRACAPRSRRIDVVITTYPLLHRDHDALAAATGTSRSSTRRRRSRTRPRARPSTPRKARRAPDTPRADRHADGEQPRGAVVAVRLR